MNVDTMRLVDKWFGIPLCCLLSGWERVARALRKPCEARPIRKILFIQLSEMGSTVSAYSAIKKVQELFPAAQLYYLMFREMQESIRLLSVIPEQNILTVPSRTLAGLVAGMLGMLVRLRRQQFDAVLDLELFARNSTIISYLANAPVRVGFDAFHMEGLYRGSLLTHRVIYNHLQHISNNFLGLVQALSLAPSDLPLAKVKINPADICLPVIASTPAAKQKMRARLQALCPELSAAQRIIVFNPNGSQLLPLRRWPMQHYVELARRLITCPSVILVITGVAAEQPDADMICSSVRSSRCINFAGQTTLRELIDLYNIADLMVSNDSGPPNFASLTALKVLVFFGPETPCCYKPLGPHVEVLYAGLLCSPCVSAYNHRKSPCTDNKCLQAISVDQVYARIRQHIPELA